MPQWIQRLLCIRWNRVLAAGVLAPLALHADVIFSNLSGNVPTGLHFLFVTGAAGVDAAEAFTPNGDFSMTDAEVIIQGGGVDLSLYSDNSGQPGSQIEELASNLNGPSGYALETANSFTPIDLTAGTQYWLVLTPASSTANAAWGDNGSTFVPRAISTDNGASWAALNFNAQFQTDGTPLTSTPEPSELPLLAGGAICLLVAAQRARASSRRSRA